MDNMNTTALNLFALNNVSLHPKVIKALAVDNEQIANPPADMHKLVMRLAMDNPLWQFVVTHTLMSSNQAVAFEIKQDGEMIGRIERAYYRGGYKLAISNDRISAKRERGDSYRTESVDKALLMAKKMFYPLKPNERMDKAYAKAMDVMNNQENQKHRERNYANRAVSEVAGKFIMGTGFHLFLEYLDKLPEHESLPIRNKMQEAEKLNTDMLTIESVRQKFSSNNAALVIKDQGKYIVKTGADVQVYDDNTLPENLRGRLGMLKLVEVEHFISNTGCRISDEIFVVLTEET